MSMIPWWEVLVVAFSPLLVVTFLLAIILALSVLGWLITRVGAKP